MTTAATKLASSLEAVPAQKADPAAPTWTEVIAGAELYWGVLGRKAAEQCRDYAIELFGGMVKPAPLILGRPSRVHGQWAPLCENLAQMRMHEPAIIDTRAHGDVKSLKSISRVSLLRGVLLRYLATNDLSPAVGGADWCVAAMTATFKLTGRKVWMAPQKFRQVSEVIGESTEPRRRQVQEQAAGPKGEISISQSEINAWPTGVVPDEMLRDITPE